MGKALNPNFLSTLCKSKSVYQVSYITKSCYQQFVISNAFLGCCFLFFSSLSTVTWCVHFSTSTTLQLHFSLSSQEHLFQILVFSPSYLKKLLKTHLCHNGVAHVIPCTLRRTDSHQNSRYIYLHRLWDKNLRYSDRYLSWWSGVFFTFFKDKVKLCPENHQSVQMRSQKCVCTKTGNTHSDKDKSSETSRATLYFIELSLALWLLNMYSTIITVLSILTHKKADYVCIQACFFIPSVDPPDLHSLIHYYHYYVVLSLFLQMCQCWPAGYFSSFVLWWNISKPAKTTK